MTGWVEKLPSGKWRACWRDPDGRRKSKTFATQREAKQHLRATRVAMDKGAYVDDGLAKVRFAEWAEHYFKVQGKRLSRKSLDRDLTFLNAYVLPKWGGVQLGKISAPAVEAWLADMGEEGAAARVGTLAPGTVEKIYQIFSKVIRAAHRDGRLPVLPLPHQLPIPRKPKRKAVRFLTEAEVAHLANSIDPFYEALVYVAAYGGFRVGELAALRMDDVDWERCTIRVDEAVTDVSGILEFEEPKTGRGRRTVPMADLPLERLRTHIGDAIDWDNRAALLFPSKEGTPLRVNNWRGRYFEPAVRAAGLAPLTPHDLRHTAASLFISAGANPWMLAEILGHTDTRMIDRVYGHLFDRDRQWLRERMSERAAKAFVDAVSQMSARRERPVEATSYCLTQGW